MTDARELYRIALTILTDIERMFIDGLGADPTHMKAAGQFATDVDLAIEQYQCWERNTAVTAGNSPGWSTPLMGPLISPPATP